MEALKAVDRYRQYADYYAECERQHAEQPEYHDLLIQYWLACVDYDLYKRLMEGLEKDLRRAGVTNLEEEVLKARRRNLRKDIALHRCALAAQWTLELAQAEQQLAEVEAKLGALQMPTSEPC